MITAIRERKGYVVENCFCGTALDLANELGDLFFWNASYNNMLKNSQLKYAQNLLKITRNRIENIEEKLMEFEGRPTEFSEYVKIRQLKADKHQLLTEEGFIIKRISLLEKEIKSMKTKQDDKDYALLKEMGFELKSSSVKKNGDKEEFFECKLPDDILRDLINEKNEKLRLKESIVDRVSSRCIESERTLAQMKEEKVM